MKIHGLHWTFAPLLLVGLTGCDVDVNDTGEAPEVNVDPGQSPDVDVRLPDVDVKTKEKEVTVPDVDVDVESRKKTIEVPDIDVNAPDEGPE